MSYMANAIIEMAEAGAVMADMDEVRAWRAAGHDVPTIWVAVDTYRGRRRMPAITLEVAERLAGSLDDAADVQALRQAVADARGGKIPVVCHRRNNENWQVTMSEAASTAATAARLAGEIVAAVARGDDLPEEWHRLEAYADIGEPIAAEVCRLVRDDLAHTGIRP